MNKVQHRSNNHVFGAPKNWDQGQLPCDALLVTVTTVEGHACIKSYWKPTLEELEVLVSGGFVELGILGMGMPPVMVNVVTE